MPDFGIAQAIESTSVQSGDASTTVFNIAHGLGVVPKWAAAIGTSSDADSDFSYTYDATNIVITYPFPPPTGSSNLTFHYRVVV